MDIAKYRKKYIKNIDNIYEKRKLEFEPENYVFDVPHKLAEKTAEYCIELLKERSISTKEKEEWHLSIPVKSIFVKHLGGIPKKFQYYLNGRKCTYETAKIAIAVNELVSAEDYVNKK